MYDTLGVPSRAHVAITAGIHGAEYVSIAAIREVVLALDPAEVRGSIVAVLTASPAAFAARSVLFAGKPLPLDSSGTAVEPATIAVQALEELRQRLVRACVLTVRAEVYVEAARAAGTRDGMILWRHILPNVMHLVLIVAVLDFSALVLYEAVLSYVGVGVDPNSSSFGSMINLARSEMSRDPVVWWNLATAFTFMLALVLLGSAILPMLRARRERIALESAN